MLIIGMLRGWWIIWSTLTTEATREDAINALKKEYDAPIEVIEKDVDTFIAKLTEENILE